MSDVITLTGLAAYGYHGVFAHERRDGQRFIVDVELELDTSRAAASDDVADTVDYGRIADVIVAIVEGEPVDLIETLAQRILDAVLADERVDAADVVVHKPQAPIRHQFEDVSVRVRRERKARA